MHIIEHKQIIATSLQECWTFFASPSNLKLLTPPYLGFSEQSNGEEMYEGQIIMHRLKPVLGVPILWVTEITHVKHLHYFVDEQRVGPYRLWHHEHRFREVSGGVEISDLIHFMLPFGILGKAIYHLKVRRDLAKIFSYRHHKIKEIFGGN